MKTNSPSLTKGLVRLLLAGSIALTIYACDKTDPITPNPGTTAPSSYIKFQDSTYNTTSQTCPDLSNPTAILSGIYSAKNISFKTSLFMVPATQTTITFNARKNKYYPNGCSNCPYIDLNFTKQSTQTDYTSVGGTLTRTASEINFDLLLQETRKVVSKDTLATKYRLIGRILCNPPA